MRLSQIKQTKSVELVVDINSLEEYRHPSNKSIRRKCLEMVRGIYQEIRKTADYRERIDIEKHAMHSESSRRRKAAVEAASWIPELNIQTDDLDTDPYLLNVQNGTVDLRTGELLEHRQGDFITRMANVEYDPSLYL